MKQSIGAHPFIFPYPVFLIGTYDEDDKANIMTASWGGICCSKPPCINISLRKATYTYNNLMQRKAFTICIPSKHQAAIADYYGISTGANTDKFADTMVTPVHSDVVDAPYGAEFPMVLECKLLSAQELGIHTIFIGEILDVKVEESMLSADYKPDISKVEPMLFSNPERAYYGIGDFIGKAFSMGRFLRKPEEE